MSKWVCKYVYGYQYVLDFHGVIFCIQTLEMYSIYCSIMFSHLLSQMTCNISKQIQKSPRNGQSFMKMYVRLQEMAVFFSVRIRAYVIILLLFFAYPMTHP